MSWTCTFGLAVTAGVISLFALEAAETSKVPALPGVIKGYTVPARDYLLKGESARPLPGGRVWIDGIKLETRRTTNQINFLLETPSGEYDRAADLISSTNTLKVRSRDDRFQLDGVGYDFQPGTNRLVIHSNVVTRFDRSFFEQHRSEARPAAPATNPAPLRITSTRLDFEGNSGDAVFHDQVRLTDGDQLEADAGELSVNIAALTNAARRVVADQGVRLRFKHLEDVADARAKQAVFSTAPGVDAQTDLSGDAAWSFKLMSGGADQVRWITVTNRYEMTGTGHARIRFPASALGTNRETAGGGAATNQAWIDLASDRHQFVPGRLVFEGGVRAVQDTNWVMSTRNLVVDVDATNHPTRMEATGDFVFELKEGLHPGRGSAGHALVENPPTGKPVVTLTETPNWVSPEFEKSADHIEVLDPLGEPVFVGDGHVRLKLAKIREGDFDWFGAKTNHIESKESGRTNEFQSALITADHSRFHAGLAVFTGKVLLVSGTNTLAADQLTLAFAANQHLTNLIASGDVKVHQRATVLAAQQIHATFDGGEQNIPHVVADEVCICGDSEEGHSRATGKRLRYDGASGEALLDGDPELVRFGPPDKKTHKPPPPYLIKAGQIVWNVRSGEKTIRNGFSGINLSADAVIPRSCD